MLKEAELRELLEKAYKAGADRVAPEDGFEYMELGHNPDDWDVMSDFITELMKEV